MTEPEEGVTVALNVIELPNVDGLAEEESDVVVEIGFVACARANVGALVARMTSAIRMYEYNFIG